MEEIIDLQEIFLISNKHLPKMMLIKKKPTFILDQRND